MIRQGFFPDQEQKTDWALESWTAALEIQQRQRPKVKSMELSNAVVSSLTFSQLYWNSIQSLKQWYVLYFHCIITNSFLQGTAVGSELRSAIKKSTASVITAAYQIIPPPTITGDMERLSFIKKRATDLLTNKKYIYATKWKDVCRHFSILAFLLILL
jgi:hypothetical protein